MFEFISNIYQSIKTYFGFNQTESRKDMHQIHFQEEIQSYDKLESFPENDYIIILKAVNQSQIGRSQITTLELKKILKEIGMTKYYEFIPLILKKIREEPLQPFNPKITQQLTEMFKAVYQSFRRIKPEGRENFLSYRYLIYKFMQLLEPNHELAQKCPFRSPKNIKSNDKIWKNICQDLRWEYISSSP